MTEEIKELLSIVSEGQDSIQRQQLVNYITNLQKENRINNDLIPCFKNREKELKKQINVLQKENEQLRTELNRHKLKNEKATSLIKRLQKQYGYVLDDLLFLLLQGGDE